MKQSVVNFANAWHSFVGFAAVLVFIGLISGCGTPSGESVEVVLPEEWPNETKFSIGEPLPDIDGVDIEGVPMRLSDFQGRVVLLVFWANW